MNEGAHVSLEALSARWQKAGFSGSALETRSDGTLLASERTVLASGEVERAEAELSPETLAMGARLGVGGMGEVRLARQGSLRREVAVKTVHDIRDARARAALLKEAWVGGALEHPNIVPVHTLAEHEDGPAIVMKRVEGRSLAELLIAPDRAANLDRHLAILGSVCRAVAFAHSQGILHLDLKPENVMVGRYGEVYLVDWGLAAGIAGAGPAWLAPASAITGIAGTPAYMAPELAAAEADAIGPATDVYLLGGVLHTILTGEPLHTGANVMQILLAAWTSPPREYGEGVPEGLAAIARRATHKEPAERYPTADALREAIELHLRRRLADRLIARATALGLELDPLLEARAGDGIIEPLLAECEEALASAEREHAGDPRSEPLRRALHERRARHAIQEERLDAAAALLARLDDPPTDLSEAFARARAAVSARAEHVAGLEAMSRELDLTLGTRSRRRLFAVLAALWLVFSIAMGVLHREGAFVLGYQELLVEGALLVATLLPYAVFARRTLFLNLANQRLYGGLIFTAVAVELHWVACALLEVPVLHAIGLTTVYYTFLFGTLGIVLDRRLALGALAFAAVGVAAALAPELALELVGIGGAAAIALTLGASAPVGAERAE